jgi:glycerol kinase
LDAIAPVSGEKTHLSVDGGLTNNSYFCQFLADVTQREIIIPASPDITTYGTGKFALIGCGMAKDTSDLPAADKPGAVITARTDLTRLKERFDDAIERSRKWR